MNWRAFARSALPGPFRSFLARRLTRGFRYKQERTSSTDYLAEFDHNSLRRAKASILWFDSWSKATKETCFIIERLGLLRDGDLVVDYGCGIGRMSGALLERYQLKIIAADRSPEMLRHARQYLPKRLLESGSIKLMTDEDLLSLIPDLAASIDTILVIEVLQHIPEPILDGLLPRLLQGLKSDGRLFVLGNRNLDVDRYGNVAPNSTEVRAVLKLHGAILREDTWSGFSTPRHSFVVAPKDGQSNG